MLLDWEEFDGTIWEPACGQGDMSRVLIDRGYGEGGVDFLKDDQISKFGKVDNIITNPPFKIATEFVLQSKKVAQKKTCIFNRTSFLEGMELIWVFLLLNRVWTIVLIRTSFWQNLLLFPYSVVRAVLLSVTN